MSELLEKNITKVYILTSLGSFILVGPILVLYMQENGLTLQEIMVLQSIFAFSIVVLEVPTGYISDRFGTKVTIVLAYLIMAISHILYILSNTFLDFLVAEIFFALSFALISGSLEAFVYNTLLSINKEDEYKKILGNMHFYSYIFGALGAITGGFLAQYGLRFTFIVNIINLSLTPLVALLLVEPLKNSKIRGKESIKEVLEVAKKTFFNGSVLKYIVLFSAVIYMFNQSVFWFYQPYLKLSGVDLVYFGIIFASFQVVAAFSSKVAHKIEKRLGLLYSFILITLLVSGSLILMGSFVYTFSFLFIYMQQFTRAFKKIIISDAINKKIDSKYRATILSLESFVSKLFISIVMPIIGYLEGVFSLEITLIIMGVFTFILSFSLILIIRRKNGIFRENRSAKQLQRGG